jgi:hypothetical protein
MNESNIAGISLSIISTVIVLYCTLILLPILRYTEKFTSKFTNFIFNDWVVITSVLNIILSFLYNLNGLLRKAKSPMLEYNHYSAGIVLLFSIITVFVVTKRIAYLFNVNSILKKILKKKVSYINKGEWEKTIYSIEEKRKDFMDIMYDISITGGSFDLQKEHAQVPKKLTDYVLETLNLFKDVLIQIYRGNQYFEFKECLEIIISLTEHYYKARRKYKINADLVTTRIYDIFYELQNIIDSKINYDFEYALINSIEIIGEKSLIVSPVGIDKGWHLTSRFFLSTLIQITEEEIKLGNINGAYDSIRCTKKLGIKMNNRGAILTLSSMLEKMYNNFKLSISKEEWGIAREAVDCILSLIYYSLSYSKKENDLSLRDFFLIKILDNLYKLKPYQYTNLIDTPLLIAKDISNDISINAMVRTSLFSNNIDNSSASNNIDVINNITKLSIRLIKNCKPPIVNFFIDQYYQIILWLISALNPDYGLKFLFETKIRVFQDDEDINKLKKIIYTSLEELFNDKSFVLSNTTISIIYLLGISKEMTDYNLEEINKEIYGLISSNIINKAKLFDENDIKKIRLLCKFLQSLGYEDIKNKLFKKIPRLNYNSEMKLIPLKDPITSYDQNYFNLLNHKIIGLIQNSG